MKENDARRREARSRSLADLLWLDAATGHTLWSASACVAEWRTDVRESLVDVLELGGALHFRIRDLDGRGGAPEAAARSREP